MGGYRAQIPRLRRIDSVQRLGPSDASDSPGHVNTQLTTVNGMDAHETWEVSLLA